MSTEEQTHPSTTDVPVGTAAWVDLSSPDIDASLAFYRGLFGWEFKSVDSAHGSHHVAKIGNVEVGGLMPHSVDRAEAPAYWAVFFYVEDVDATGKRAVQAGGSVEVPRFEIPGGAQVSVIADRGGALFVVISAGPNPKTFFSMQPGAVSWVELSTRTPDQATAFYTAVFGWSASTQETADGVDYTVYAVNDEPVGGMIETPSQVPAEVPDGWSAYFTVADCDTTLTRATELGGEVLLPSTATEMGPFAVILDPQGAVFQIMQYTESTEAEAVGSAPS